VKRTVTATVSPTPSCRPGYRRKADVGRLIAVARGNCQGHSDATMATAKRTRAGHARRTRFVLEPKRTSERYFEFCTQSIQQMTEDRQFAKTVTRPQSTEPWRKKAGGEGFGRSRPSVESRGSAHQTPNSAVWLDLQGAGERVANGSGGGSGIRTHDTVSRIHAFQASAFSHSATPPGTSGAI
jgi:hypothetical protein